MKIAVYALTRSAGCRVTGRGVSGDRLRVVRAGAVAAVVGDVARPPAPTEAKLRAYAALLASLAGTHQAVLPVRFGTVMQDDEELETVLRARQAAIRSQLGRVRGRTQMTVRMLGGGAVPASRPQPATRGAVTGAAYLSARARAQRASSLPGFAPLGRAVARWVKDERVERHGTVATVYHLIPRAAAGRYSAAIAAAAAVERVRVRVSGPWPPHAFGDSW